MNNYSYICNKYKIVDMIVKIFKAAQSFAGVNYNERKNEEGRSELLSAANFAINPENLKKSDYIAYMERVCMTNSRVKGKQFHATISCKGQEYSVEQLKDIAIQFVNKMGYGNNPYLIYFHSDTANNHVHIVSTRVTKDGKKVDDKFEHVRAQKSLNEILQVDLSEKAKKDISIASLYSFTTQAQLRMIFEDMGWKTSVKDNNLYLHKSGMIQAKVDLSKFCYKSPDSERKKQLTAIMHKYKEGLNYLELQSLMRQKFGVELVFHTAKGHSIPYGYTVIDRKGKSVFKGSEIMNLKDLLIQPSSEQKVKNCNAIINAIITQNPRCSTELFKIELAKLGYNFSFDGKIRIKGDRKILLTIDENLLESLRYESRVNEANKFVVSGAKEADVLSKLYNINVNDVVIAPSEFDRLSYSSLYADMLKSYIEHSSDVKSTLEEKGFVFIMTNDDAFLIDKNEKKIVSSTDLGLDINKLQGKEKVEFVLMKNYDKELVSDSIKNDGDIARGIDILDVVCAAMSQNYNVQSDRPRKKKKKVER